MNDINQVVCMVICHFQGIVPGRKLAVLVLGITTAWEYHNQFPGKMHQTQKSFNDNLGIF